MIQTTIMLLAAIAADPAPAPEWIGPLVWGSPSATGHGDATDAFNALVAADPIPDLVIDQKFTIWIDLSQESLDAANQLSEVARVELRRFSGRGTQAHKRAPIVAFHTQWGPRTICGWTSFGEFAAAHAMAHAHTECAAVQYIGGRPARPAVSPAPDAIKRTSASPRVAPLIFRRSYRDCDT